MVKAIPGYIYPALACVILFCGFKSYHTRNHKTDPEISIIYIWYRDADGDGFGDPDNSKTTDTTVAPSGYVANNTDCDDTNPNVWRTGIFYQDMDGDGYTVGNGVSLCYGNLTPGNYNATRSATDDCNDLNPSVHSEKTFFKDLDGDGYDGGAFNFCSTGPPPGYRTRTAGPDCDDNDPSIGPPHTYYRDADGDGYGDPADSKIDCSIIPPPGYVENSQDCDDNLITYADNDLDGLGAGNPVPCGVTNNNDCDDNDPAIGAGHTYYRDADGDGYGDPNNYKTECSSTAPVGYVDNNYDCDDTQKEKKSEDEKVIMCHNGKQECVPAKDIRKKLSEKNNSWTLGACIQSSCSPDETILCHDGKPECVKNKEVRDKLKDSRHWSDLPCTPKTCSPDESLLCHDGKPDCVKTKDVQQRLKDTRHWSKFPCNPVVGSRMELISESMDAMTSSSNLVPSEYKLSNYPNPFALNTSIRYDIPFDSWVTMKVYNSMGQEVSTLVNEFRKAGSYHTELSAAKFANGLYTCRIVAIYRTQPVIQSIKLVVGK